MLMTAYKNAFNSKSVMIPRNRYLPSGTYTDRELKAIVKAFNQLENRNAARFILDMMIE